MLFVKKDNNKKNFSKWYVKCETWQHTVISWHSLLISTKWVVINIYKYSTTVIQYYCNAKFCSVSAKQLSEETVWAKPASSMTVQQCICLQLKEVYKCRLYTYVETTYRGVKLWRRKKQNVVWAAWHLSSSTICCVEGASEYLASHLFYTHTPGERGLKGPSRCFWYGCTP